MTPQIASLDHLVLTVSDIEKTITFYRDVLGMTDEVFHPSDGTSRHALKFGKQKINLHQAGKEFEPKAAHVVPGSADLCFLTEDSVDDWSGHLNRCGVAIELGPIHRTGAAAPILSLYVRDPDGNLIEIGTCP